MFFLSIENKHLFRITVLISSDLALLLCKQFTSVLHNKVSFGYEFSGKNSSFLADKKYKH